MLSIVIIDIAIWSIEYAQHVDSARAFIRIPPMRKRTRPIGPKKIVGQKLMSQAIPWTMQWRITSTRITNDNTEIAMKKIPQKYKFQALSLHMMISYILQIPRTCLIPTILRVAPIQIRPFLCSAPNMEARAV
jgi:hypothetical protein